MHRFHHRAVSAVKENPVRPLDHRRTRNPGKDVQVSPSSPAAGDGPSAGRDHDLPTGCGESGLPEGQQVQPSYRIRAAAHGHVNDGAVARKHRHPIGRALVISSRSDQRPNIMGPLDVRGQGVQFWDAGDEQQVAIQQILRLLDRRQSPLFQGRVKDQADVWRANLGWNITPPDQLGASGVSGGADDLNHRQPGEAANEGGEEPGVADQDVGMETIHDVQLPLHCLLHGLGRVEAISHSLKV